MLSSQDVLTVDADGHVLEPRGHAFGAAIDTRAIIDRAMPST